MTRILVTGADGFIGGALFARLFRDQGQDVLRWTHAMGDLRQPLVCAEAVRNIDIIYHFAAVTAGAGVVVADPMALVTSNLVMFATLIDAAHKADVKKFIFPSSTTGYPDSPEPMREEDYFTGTPFKGYYPIGMTKRYLEQLAAMYPMDTVALRATNVYGPGDNFDPTRSHVIPATIRKVAERHDPLVVWGDGYDERDAIHIDDMVEACVRAMALSGHEAINLGLGHGYSVRDMLAILCGHIGFSPCVTYDLSKPSLLKKRAVDITKAKMLLSWQATISMETGLPATLDWYRDHQRAPGR